MGKSDRLDDIRQAMRRAAYGDENEVLAGLRAAAGLNTGARSAIFGRAVKLVEKVRAGSASGMLEGFLAEYSLSTHEGVALMCLAEALLRVPDTPTIDDLIEDKIARRAGSSISMRPTRRSSTSRRWR